MEESFVCCLCHRNFTGWGNDPYPVSNKGQCCDSCNASIVVPARIQDLMKEGKNGSKSR